ncbi:MAG: hypothetical protein ACLFWF_12485 [Alphaproteobacteria bacterium]
MLRMFFWAGILMLTLALAPDFGVLGPAADRGRDKAGVQDLFYIVSETASDMGGICGRRPEVCERFDRIWTQFRNRAVRLTGAAHDWLIGQEFAGNAPPAAGPQAPERAGPPPERNGGDAWHLAETPPEDRQ